MKWKKGRGEKILIVVFYACKLSNETVSIMGRFILHKDPLWYIKRRTIMRTEKRLLSYRVFEMFLLNAIGS